MIRGSPDSLRNLWRKFCSKPDSALREVLLLQWELRHEAGLMVAPAL
jgi:hypothetical protein